LFACGILGLAAVLPAAELPDDLRATDGRPVVAAVRLYDREGRLQIPAAAVDLGGMGFHYTAGDLIHYADWTSPCVRSQDPFFGSSWFRQQHPPGTACFFVKSGFQIELPAGDYRLVVNKGLEYTPVERTIKMERAARRETVTLSRWVDMAARGWFSGDDHVHIERATPDGNRNALLWAQAEDVRVCNVLLMGDAKEIYYRQYAFGPGGRAQQNATWLVPGQEEPRTAHLGHTLHLNVAAPARGASAYYDYGPVFARHRERGLSGFAHVGRRRWFFQADRGLTLLAPAGLVDFVEIAQMGYIGVDRWFEFLNLGFRLTAMAGNDVPWGGTIGSTRVYAHTGTQFDPDRWFEAVRQGRTFVTTGPMLEFAVNGKLPGTVLPARKGDRLRVEARAWGANPGARPVRLKLVSFGDVLNEVAGDGALELSMEVPVTRSLWITASCETNPKQLMDVPGYFSGAVATPVYVEMDGRPTRDETHLAALVQRRMQTLDEIERWLAAGLGSIASGGAGGWESPESFQQSIPAIRRQVAAARAYFAGMTKQEAGGEASGRR
jgi:hypothetical protein